MGRDVLSEESMFCSGTVDALPDVFAGSPVLIIWVQGLPLLCDTPRRVYRMITRICTQVCILE